MSILKDCQTNMASVPKPDRQMVVKGLQQEAADACQNNNDDNV